MKRWERPLLLFSIALNVGFVSLAAVRLAARPQGELEMRAPESGRRGPFAPGWQGRRHAAIARHLELDAAQRRDVDAVFDRIRPELRAARQGVVEARAAYARAFASGDAAAAHAAVRTLSRAQARIDSLCAEAMLCESSVLHPDQRERYLRCMFRHGPGPQPHAELPGEPWPGHGPGPRPGACPGPEGDL